MGIYTLALSSLNDLNQVSDKEREVRDAIVDVCRFVDPNEWFVENHKEIFEQLECNRL